MLLGSQSLGLDMDQPKPIKQFSFLCCGVRDTTLDNEKILRTFFSFSKIDTFTDSSLLLWILSCL